MLLPASAPVVSDAIVEQYIEGREINVGLLGKGGGPARELCDVALVVPLATTSDRIQEIHIKVLHATIEAVERRMFPANY